MLFAFTDVGKASSYIQK